MGTLVALYKPFDLSLQNLIKHKYLLYISLLFVWFRLCPLTQGKKKGNERVGREKRKKDQMTFVSTSLFAFSLLLSSQLMCVFLFFFWFFVFVSFLFCSFSFFCHFLLVFNLLFVKINKSIKKDYTFKTSLEENLLLLHIAGDKKGDCTHTQTFINDKGGRT